MELNVLTEHLARSQSRSQGRDESKNHKQQQWQNGVSSAQGSEGNHDEGQRRIERDLGGQPPGLPERRDPRVGDIDLEE